MAKEIRINQLHAELHKSIKNSCMSHSILATLYSHKAMQCAYKGIQYTISTIIKDLQDEKLDISLQEYNDKGKILIFNIVRRSKFIAYNIFMTVYTIEENKQIMFDLVIIR